MKKIYIIFLISTVFLINNNVSADWIDDGEKMPENIRNVFRIMAHSYQQGSLARMMRERRAMRLTGEIDQFSAEQMADQINVPLFLGRYSNTTNMYSQQQFQDQIFGNNPNGNMCVLLT